jgi:hypothetical protein
MKTNLTILSIIIIAIWAIDVLADLVPTNSYLVSGYANMDNIGDTLYVNAMFGHGVERYDISDPANPVLMDREIISGFNIIDFDRRQMFEQYGTKIRISDFSDFANTVIMSEIDLSGYLQPKGLHLIGNRITAYTESDSLKMFDISTPNSPQQISSVYFSNNRQEIGSDIAITFDTTISGRAIIGIYDISQPGQINLVHKDSVTYQNFKVLDIFPVVGDTMAIQYFQPPDAAVFFDFVRFYSNGEVELIHVDTTTFSINAFGAGNNAYATRYLDDSLADFYSLSDFRPLGRHLWLHPDQFNNIANNIVAFTSSAKLQLCIPGQTGQIMPICFENQPDNYSTISVYSYFDSITQGNYLLCGVDSVVPKIMIYSIEQSGELSLQWTIPGLSPRKVVFENNIAFCAGISGFMALDLSTINQPLGPQIIHEYSDFEGPIRGFEKRDSLIYAYSFTTFYVINYNRQNGFSLVSSLYFPDRYLMGLASGQLFCWLLKGTTGIVDVINVGHPENPFVARSERLPFSFYQTMAMIDSALFFFGPHGTSVCKANLQLDSITTIGPEYFSDVYQAYSENDTLYIADGINGIKAFSYTRRAYQELELAGSYNTRNYVKSIAKIGHNFYLADYYSLQYLRMEPTGGIVDRQPEKLPTKITLSPNYPNPFNSSTTIRYTISVSGPVTLDIYDILGRKVQTLIDINQPAGEYQAVWEADKVGSGFYFARLNAGGQSQTTKLIFLK